MKKIVLICFCGLGFILKGMSIETVHCKNIEYAITQFSSTMTNDIQSMEHDFIAILGEIKDLNSKVARINLLTNLANRLCAVSKDIWKCKNAYSYQCAPPQVRPLFINVSTATLPKAVKSSLLDTIS